MTEYPGGTMVTVVEKVTTLQACLVCAQLGRSSSTALQ